MPGVAATPVAELVAITKHYGSVLACDRADLVLRAGEVHGVLGENGAGKTTLMKVLAGLTQPDGGRVLIDGRPHVIQDPRVAAGLGIAMVHQHFSLVDALTVWENVLLGDGGRFDRRRARREVMEVSERYGLRIDPDAQVGDLTVGVRQRIELVKCLRRDPRIVILDEPTSVLTPAESTQLFLTLREAIAAEGRTVVLVSHKLAEVMEATDTVSVMHRGRVVASHPTAETSADELARRLVGRRAVPIAGQRDDRTRTRAEAGGPAVLVLDEARLERRGQTLLDGLSLRVAAGEIVGVAGVEGNGQRPLADVLSSLEHLDSGTVSVDGTVVRTGRAGAMARAGIGVIPEDRHDSGCVLDMSIAANLVLDDPVAVSRHGLIDRATLNRRARELMDDYGVRGEPDAPLRTLSGGNQQRVVVARELSRAPRVLVAAQPTRGLDLSSAAQVTERIVAVAAAGTAVLWISNELDELLAVAHRIVVLSRGRVIGEVDGPGATADRLGLLLGGVGAP